jgi:crotonobetainyl-CoA:carnitine CoA-transferase CaiB-like acyl-CoA transferase
LFDTALSLLTYVGTWAASRGHVTERRAESAHPSIVPFQAFQTADGWITVACAKQKFWLALRDALELEDDPRFADFEGRAEHREELLAILRPRLRAMTTDEALERLVGVPCGPVKDVLGALDEGTLVSYEHPTLGTVRQVAAPYRMGTTYERAPRRGEHTEALLRELCGYDDAALARAREGGAFG